MRGEVEDFANSAERVGGVVSDVLEYGHEQLTDGKNKHEALAERVTVAEGAIVENRQAIEAEVQRAQEKENQLSTVIGKQAGDIAGMQSNLSALTPAVLKNEEAIEAEVTRAQAAEQALGAEITEAENRVDERVTEVRDNLEAEVQARSAAVSDLNANTGISEYPAFDPAEAYAVGDVVSYEGRLYRFTAEHAAGAWIGTDAESWSERKAANSILPNGLELLQGFKDSDLRVAKNFDYFIPYVNEEFFVRVVFNDDTYDHRIIISTKDGDKTIDNAVGDIEVANLFLFRYNWEKHNKNYNSSTNLIKVRRNKLAENISDGEDKIINLNSAISNLQGAVFDTESTEQISISTEISEAYIGKNIILGNLKGYPLFIVKSYKVSKGELYSINSDSFTYPDINLPVVAFSKNDISINGRGDAVILKLESSNPSSINILYRAQEDGYLWCANADRGELIVSKVTNIKNRLDKLYEIEKQLGEERKDIERHESNLNKINGDYYYLYNKDTYEEAESVLTGGYILLSGVAGVLSSENFLIKSIPVKKGIEYNIYSESYRLSSEDEFGAVAFSTESAAGNRKAQEIIYQANNILRNVDIVYSPKEDGYLWIAEVKITNTNLNVFEREKEAKYNEQYKLFRGSKLNVHDELIGGYLIGDPPRVLSLGDSYNNFKVKSVKVDKGNTYLVYSDGHALKDEFPAVAFSLKSAIASTTSEELIYAADTTQKTINIYYTPQEDGYILIAEAGDGEINVYTLKKELRLDYIEEKVKALETYSDNQLYNKNIAILGDSIMMLMRSSGIDSAVSFVGEDGNTYDIDRLSVNNGKVYVTDSGIECKVVNSNQYAWDNQDWQRLKQLLGVKALTNLGLGGAAYTERDIVTEYPFADNVVADGFLATSIPNQVRWLKRLVSEGIKDTPDAIVVWAGTNNSGYTNLDNYEEVMIKDWSVLSDDEQGFAIRKTVYGGLRYTIESLVRAFPESTICIVAPCQSRYSANKEYDSGNLPKVVDAIRKMANRYSCIYIDAYHEIGICDLFEKINGDNNTSNTWYYDGLHPNGKGKILFANYLAKRLNNLFFSKI